MIQAGNNITSKDDPLQKIKVEYLYHKLMNPNPEIASKIRQLRIIRQLDTKQYSTLKRQLPYIVCGIFNPPYRKTENFGYTEYFMVDMDHISHKELSVDQLRMTLITDERVVMCFVSPGEDGLKVLFRLSERCYDAGLYSLFYKLFVLQLAKQYGLEQVVDVRTSDVARACFISYDPDVYFNPKAQTVDMSCFLNSEDTSELFRLKKQTESETDKQNKNQEKEIKSEPADEALQRIKLLLNPNGKKPVAKPEAFVPEELNVLIGKLVPYIEETNVAVAAVENISFGKKMKFKAGLKEAEINIFYGRKGYSVVISPRRGTNDELNTLMAQLIEQFLYQN